MKICIVGPGYMPIPPKGWGAVEILINDYRESLIKLGHQVEIVNTRNLYLAISLINCINPDFVHIQYEEYAPISSRINCKNIAITSHYAYLTQPHKWDSGYRDIFWNTVNSRAKIFALSEEISEIYEKAGISKNNIRILPNGVRTDLFKFSEECENPNQSIYLAKIEKRKRQNLSSHVDGVKFVGNIQDYLEGINESNYLGEWSKENLYQNLTKFSNLVLLSDGEAHPLVCMEALSSGLGLVLSEQCTANLDTTKPFITVIPESRIEDKEYVKHSILKNRELSLKKRKEIREYSLEFDWNKKVKSYIDLISSR